MLKPLRTHQNSVPLYECDTAVTTTSPRWPERPAPRAEHRQVLLLGQPGGLDAALRCALADHGVTTTDDPGDLEIPETGEAFVIVVTEAPPEPRRWGLSRWRDHAAHRVREDHLTADVVDAAGTVPGIGVLVLCETSATTPSPQAIRTTRQLARRMAYECALNGAPVGSTNYMVINDATLTTAIAAAVAWWKDCCYRSA